MPRRDCPEYYELFQRVLSGKDPLRVPLASAQEARNLRSYLYHFRRILREKNHPLSQGADSIRLRIHPDGLELEPPTAPGAEEIRKAL